MTVRLEGGIGLVFLVVGVLAANGCAPDAKMAPATGAADRVVEAESILGGRLYRPALSAENLARHTEQLDAARREHERRPNDEMASIWVGRRLAYLGRYNEAIEWYSRAIERFPDSFRLLRHRGHRYITTRQFDRAIADLATAAEMIQGLEPGVEPDGLPNAAGIPTGTTHTSIYYHLGLAHYLNGDYENARTAYLYCEEASDNDDMLCATLYWLYLTDRRLGLHRDARNVLHAANADMSIIENHAYHKLLLLYKGEMSIKDVLDDPNAESAPTGAAVQNATAAYGIASHHLNNGDVVRALEMMHDIMEGDSWAAFGAIAAEADLARMRVEIIGATDN